MYEVEVKVPADHGPVRERLSSRDAERTGTVHQVDTYYAAPHRDFAETDEAVRIRRVDGAAVLTYKGPKVDADSKAREEIETSVADGEAADALLRSLGFDPVATVEKDREYFELEGYVVTLDAVAGLGEFVEVETDAEAVETAREGAFDVLADLGLDPEDQIRTSYLELLLEDARE